MAGIFLTICNRSDICRPSICHFVMHQSIPAVPCPPPPLGNCGAFARLVSPGGGTLANSERPGGRVLANPGGTPEKFVDVFQRFFNVNYQNGFLN